MNIASHFGIPFQMLPEKPELQPCIQKNLQYLPPLAVAKCAAKFGRLVSYGNSK